MVPYPIARLWTPALSRLSAHRRRRLTIEPLKCALKKSSCNSRSRSSKTNCSSIQGMKHTWTDLEVQVLCGPWLNPDHKLITKYTRNYSRTQKRYPHPNQPCKCPAKQARTCQTILAPFWEWTSRPIAGTLLSKNTHGSRWTPLTAIFRSRFPSCQHS